MLPELTFGVLLELVLSIGTTKKEYTIVMDGPLVFILAGRKIAIRRSIQKKMTM